jgi:hypothetical protein
VLLLSLRFHHWTPEQLKLVKRIGNEDPVWLDVRPAILLRTRAWDSIDEVHIRRGGIVIARLKVRK